MNGVALTRREFLSGGGALVVSFALCPRAAAQAGETATGSAGAKLPGSLDKFPMLDSWIRIGADGLPANANELKGTPPTALPSVMMSGSIVFPLSRKY